MEVDPELVRRHFEEQIVKRVRDWMALAAERLEGSGVPVLLMPGNDDDFAIDPILAESTYARDVNGQVVELTPWHQLVSMGWSSPTPWSTPRELPEEEFLDRLRAQLRLDEAGGDQRLRLGGEGEAAGDLRRVERLDAEGVAGEDEAAGGAVVQGDAVHAAQVVHEG